MDVTFRFIDIIISYSKKKIKIKFSIVLGCVGYSRQDDAGSAASRGLAPPTSLLRNQFSNRSVQVDQRNLIGLLQRVERFGVETQPLSRLASEGQLSGLINRGLRGLGNVNVQLGQLRDNAASAAPMRQGDLLDGLAGLVLGNDGLGQFRGVGGNLAVHDGFLFSV